MKKISVEVPEDVYAAIEDEGQREFRNVSQQASYLLLVWSREAQTKSQKTAKLSPPVPQMRPADPLNGPAV